MQVGILVSDVFPRAACKRMHNNGRGTAIQRLGARDLRGQKPNSRNIF
jgi:hypothetical protein